MKKVVAYNEICKRGAAENTANGEYQSLREVGRQDLPSKRVKAETMEELDELKAARKRIRELEAALADAQMDWLLESSFLDIACEQLGTTAEDLKKRTHTFADRRKQKGKF